jgi:hypothetical protein
VDEVAKKANNNTWLMAPVQLHARYALPCRLLDTEGEAEAKLDQDSASFPWWRSPRGLSAASKQVFFLNDSWYAADT